MESGSKVCPFACIIIAGAVRYRKLDLWEAESALVLGVCNIPMVLIGDNFCSIHATPKAAPAMAAGVSAPL